MNKCTAFFLIFLRLAIGWHFLAEGYHKLEGYWRGPTETVVGKAKPFSSAGYFREGTGPVAKLIRQQVGDPDSEALGRLEALPKSGDSASVPPHMRTPPLLAREWSDYVKRFGDYYGLDDKQRQEAEGKLQQTEDAVVLWLTKEDVDEKTKAIKKTFQSNTVEVKLPMPQRIAEYKAKLTDLRDTMNNRLYLMGHDVEGRRLLETKADTARLRSALLADLDDYTKELQKSLETLPTEEQKEQAAKKDTILEPVPQPSPAPSALQKWIDLSTMYGLAILGACLVLGLFTRTACVLSAGFLLMTYLCVPPWPWLPVAPNNEGYYAFVNKNVIEMLALLVLATTASGRWFGLDALIHAILFGWRRPAA
ncbi:MAG TPA: DoxX family protein [Gemmataceae bacterium]|nr:DoxX family protein [Gemmataceae bacterium]